MRKLLVAFYRAVAEIAAMMRTTCIITINDSNSKQRGINREHARAIITWLTNVLRAAARFAALRAEIAAAADEVSSAGAFTPLARVRVGARRFAIDRRVKR